MGKSRPRRTSLIPDDIFGEQVNSVKRIKSLDLFLGAKIIEEIKESDYRKIIHFIARRAGRYFKR